MANGALITTWGSSARGREIKGLEVFSEALTYFDNLAKQGRIQGVRTYVANTEDMSELAGMLIVEGELSELQAVQLEPDYQSSPLRLRTSWTISRSSS